MYSVTGRTVYPSAYSATCFNAVIQVPDTIKKADTAFGTILMDGQGKTLYYFTLDQYTNGGNACDAVCSVAWPVFYTDAIAVSSPLNPADFGSITRADGSKQTTYKGVPLYFYAGDTQPGTSTDRESIKCGMSPISQELFQRPRPHPRQPPSGHRVSREVAVAVGAVTNRIIFFRNTGFMTELWKQ